MRNQKFYKKMKSKCKKSSYQQLQALVEYMEEHPDFARGTAVYGGNKMYAEEQWVGIVKKLNSIGPPLRTILEWKKTWADLKSRTKKKIAQNYKSLRETDGGLYRMSNLTELEQIIDRTLSLSEFGAPADGVFGYPDYKSNSVELTNDFEQLIDIPTKGSSTVAVITPTRQQQKSFLRKSRSDTQSTEHTNDWFLPNVMKQEPSEKRDHSETEEELPGCSTAKRQMHVSEPSSATEVAKTLAESMKALVTAVTRMADAAETQAAASKANAETQLKILKSIDAFRKDLANYSSKK